MLRKPSFIKKGGFACQWLGNVKMHKNTKCDQNIPYGSREMNIFTNAPGRTDLLT